MRNMRKRAPAPAPDQLAVAERLRAARKAAGYAEAIDFYEVHGIPQGTYANHENGSRSFDAEKARFYAERLGNVTASWLLFGEGDPPREMPAKSPRGKRAALIESKLDGDSKEESLNKKMFFIWESLHPDVKIAALTIIETIADFVPRKS